MLMNCRPSLKLKFMWKSLLSIERYFKNNIHNHFVSFLSLHFASKFPFYFVSPFSSLKFSWAHHAPILYFLHTMSTALWGGGRVKSGGGSKFPRGSPNRLRINLLEITVLYLFAPPFLCPLPANFVLRTNKRQKRSLLTKQGNECSRKIIFHCAIIP